jgi:WD40 repeat protein
MLLRSWLVGAVLACAWTAAGCQKGAAPITAYSPSPQQHPPHTTISALAFSPDGNSLLIGFNGTRQALVHWNMETGTVQAIQGHAMPISYLAFLPGGKQAISSSWDQTIRVIDITTGAIIQEYKGSSVCSMSPDGRYFLSSGVGDQPQLREVQNGSVIRAFPPQRGVSAFAFAPNNTTAIWGSGPGHRLKIERRPAVERSHR